MGCPSSKQENYNQEDNNQESNIPKAAYNQPLYLNLNYPNKNDNIKSKNNKITKTLKSGTNSDKNIEIFLGINIGSYKTVYSIFEKEDKNYVYKVILMNGN